MSDQSPPPTPGTGGRRPSITEMFMPRPTTGPQSSAYSPPNASLSSHVGCKAQNQRRGMSITTLGLSGSSPNQTSPLSAFAKQRRASTTSSSASGSPEFRNGSEDSAVIEEEANTGMPANTPATPSFARRLSFGAQALRDVRGSGPTSGVEAFDWSENLRDRTKRRPSISAHNNSFPHRQRAASVATVEVPKEIPKPQTPAAATKPSKPDQLGERMLRGDFMMD